MHFTQNRCLIEITALVKLERPNVGPLRPWKTVIIEGKFRLESVVMSSIDLTNSGS